MNTPNIRALALARLLRCTVRPAGEQPSGICHSCEYRLVELVDDYPDIPIPPDCFIDGRGAWVSCDFERLAKDAAETLEYLGGGALAEVNAKLEAELAAFRNELCLWCGKYTDAHNGACDGCRWRGET